MYRSYSYPLGLEIRVMVQHRAVFTQQLLEREGGDMNTNTRQMDWNSHLQTSSAHVFNATIMMIKSGVRKLNLFAEQLKKPYGFALKEI